MNDDSQFVESLRATGLMEDHEVAEIAQTISAAGDAARAADKLVAGGRLTKYQADQLLVGGTTNLVLGEYVVLDRIGRGGMGEVFKARHRRMNRVVALKMMRSGFSKADMERFQQEVQAAAKLTHPNIVTAHDAGEAAGIPFLVMEYVEGADLATLLAIAVWLDIRTRMVRHWVHWVGASAWAASSLFWAIEIAYRCVERLMGGS